MKVTQRITGDRPVFSVEFFPPKDEAGEAELWRAIRRLEPLDPAFVSVTYGAGGSSRDRTIRTTARIATDTTLVPMAHLTAVSHSVAELRQVIGAYAAAGIQNVLAVRGDPPGDPLGEWVAHPEGLTYADELVTLVRRLGDFCVGRGGVPLRPPALRRRRRRPRAAGGEDPRGRRLRDQPAVPGARGLPAAARPLVAAGCDVPLLPGIMPLTTAAARCAGARSSPVPRCLRSWWSGWSATSDDPVSFRAAGMDATAELCARLLDEGVCGLHFYTLNRSIGHGRAGAPARAGRPQARAERHDRQRIGGLTGGLRVRRARYHRRARGERHHGGEPERPVHG